MADQENLAPAATTEPTSNEARPKRPPPITPKRFTRFFTPRTASGRINKPTSQTSRVLREITHNAVNRRFNTSPRSASKKSVLFADITKHDSAHNTPSIDVTKKRKSTLAAAASSSPQSSPCKRVRLSPSRNVPSSPPQLDSDDERQLRASTHTRDQSPEPPMCLPIRRAKINGLSSRALERSFGAELDGVAKPRRTENRIYWQSQTANFCSSSSDVHQFQRPALPFCSASCRTNSLVAIADELGGVHLIDSDLEANPDFGKLYLKLQPHSNAVLDMSFSSNDMLLATAAGDQTTRLTDMRTQQTTFVMRGHGVSVKQVRFQPGNDNVLATSGREGNIFIWDTRCRSSEKNEVMRASKFTLAAGPGVKYPCVYTSFLDAHADRHGMINRQGVEAVSGGSTESSSRDGSYRRAEASVTSLTFLSADRPYLLLSASDASTSVKLWDVRSRYSRRGPAIPIATTAQPDSHLRHRPYGITSMALSGNNSKLYAASKDNTIYAYETSHLVLGSAPELSGKDRNRVYSVDKPGLGPVYGFRHHKFNMATFYVRVAVRPAKGDAPEMLAVGSSEHNPIVFPTDERFFGSIAPHSKQSTIDTGDLRPITPNLGHPSLPSPLPRSSANRPSMLRTPSGRATRMIDKLPIYNTGTVLTGGHSKEVTSVTWSADGQLISASDDYTARRWGEDRSEAAYYRGCSENGEGHARRWKCGWAESETGDAEWDEEDW